MIVSGCSSGGQAVYNWAQYFGDLFPPTVDVMAVPDSGLFLDLKSVYQIRVFRNYAVKGYFNIVDVESDPINSECVKANPNEKWKCLMSPYLIDHIKVPLFFVQSQYDWASIIGILGLPCAMSEDWNSNSLDNCSVVSKFYIEMHHRKT